MRTARKRETGRSAGTIHDADFHSWTELSRLEPPFSIEEAESRGFWPIELPFQSTSTDAG